MSKIYEQSKDLHIRRTYIYTKEGGGFYAYADSDAKIKLSAFTLRDIFLKGAVILDTAIEYLPVAYSEEDGVGSLLYIKQGVTAPEFATLMSEEYVSLTLTVAADNTETDLHTDVVVANGAIAGTLKYVTEYTDFSDDPDEQSGNYLALNITTVPTTNVVITAELLGEGEGAGEGEAIVLTGGSGIFRITDTATQAIAVVATDGETTITNVYTLGDMILEEAAE